MVSDDQYDILRKQRLAAVDFDYDAAEKQKMEHCNLCGSTSWQLIADQDRYNFHVNRTI
jgi:hypothetical protein